MKPQIDCPACGCNHPDWEWIEKGTEGENFEGWYCPQCKEAFISRDRAPYYPMGVYWGVYERPDLEVIP